MQLLPQKNSQELDAFILHCVSHFTEKSKESDVLFRILLCSLQEALRIQGTRHFSMHFVLSEGGSQKNCEEMSHFNGVIV